MNSSTNKLPPILSAFEDIDKFQRDVRLQISRENNRDDKKADH